MRTIIETAFLYDENGLIKQTQKEEECAILIDNSKDNLLRDMINTYHNDHSTYKITVTELARRIRVAIFAGYLIPRENLDINDEPLILLGNGARWTKIN